MEILYAGQKPEEITTGGQRRVRMLLEYLSKVNGKVIYLQTTASPGNFIKRNFLLTNLWYIFRIIKMNRNDTVIILEDYSQRFYLFLFNTFISLSLLRNVKLVCLTNAFYFSYRKSRLKNLIDKIVSAIFLKPADLVISSGQAAEKELIEMGVPAKKIRAVYPALRHELAQVHPADEASHQNSPVKLLFIGRLNPIKGLEYLLEAVELLHDCNFTLSIVGSASSSPKYAYKIINKINKGDLRDRVKIEGEIDNVKKLLEKYREADVLVLPSLWDTSPITIIEATCMGLPVVATNVGGIPEWVENGVSGILVPPKDPQSLAAALGRLIQNPDLRQKLGRAGYEKSFRFRDRTWENVSREYYNILQNIARPKPRQLILMPNSYPPQVGGLEIALVNLSEQLASKGYRPIVIAGSSSLEFSRKTEPSGVTVYRIPFILPRIVTSAGNKKMLISIVKTLFSPLLTPMALLITLIILKSTKPAVVNLHYIAENAFFCIAAKKLMNFKLIVNIHGSDIEKYFRRSYFSRWLIKYTLKTADTILSNSEYLLRRAEEICPGIQPKSCVVGNGVDTQAFNRLPATSRTQKYLLSVGNFAFNKGFDILIRAFHIVNRRNPSVNLFMAGAGSELKKCISLAEKLGLNGSVKFLGRVKNSDIASLLAGCEFFVMPSRKEAFGMVVLEAMAAKKAVISFSVGGVPEIITHNDNGLLVKPNSSEDLAEAIQSLLDDETLRERLGSRGYQIAQRFEWNEISQRYIREYEAVSKC